MVFFLARTTSAISPRPMCLAPGAYSRPSQGPDGAPVPRSTPLVQMVLPQAGARLAAASGRRDVGQGKMWGGGVGHGKKPEFWVERNRRLQASGIEAAVACCQCVQASAQLPRTSWAGRESHIKQCSGRELGDLLGPQCPREVEGPGAPAPGLGLDPAARGTP